MHHASVLSLPVRLEAGFDSVQGVDHGDPDHTTHGPAGQLLPECRHPVPHFQEDREKVKLQAVDALEGFPV